MLNFDHQLGHGISSLEFLRLHEHVLVGYPEERALLAVCPRILLLFGHSGPQLAKPSVRSGQQLSHVVAILLNCAQLAVVDSFEEMIGDASADLERVVFEVVFDEERNRRRLACLTPQWL